MEFATIFFTMLRAMSLIFRKESARHSSASGTQGDPMTPPNRTGASHAQWGPALGCLLLALTTFALVTSCGEEAAEKVPPVDWSATAAPPTTPAQETVSSAPRTTVDEGPSLAEGEAPDDLEGTVFPRHGQTIAANRGDRYVYGELSISDDCLRVSYSDQTDREATRDGLLVVWPIGFGNHTRNGVVEVTGTDGRVVAAEGQTVRLSGKKVLRRSAAIDEWDWGNDEAGQCGGPFWLVGDEVSVMRAGATGSVVSDGVFLPRLYEQRGPIVSPLAATAGRLMLVGRCLMLDVAYRPGEYLVVWPPGFNVQREGNGILVLNGGGSVIAKVGDEVTLGGGSGKEGADYPGECPGPYFKAYSVQTPPSGQNSAGGSELATPAR